MPISWAAQEEVDESFYFLVARSDSIPLFLENPFGILIRSGMVSECTVKFGLICKFYDVVSLFQIFNSYVVLFMCKLNFFCYARCRWLLRFIEYWYIMISLSCITFFNISLFLKTWNKFQLNRTGIWFLQCKDFF